MAGAKFFAVGTRSQSSGNTQRAPSLPSGVASGRGILLCAVHSKNNATHSTATSGWTKIGQWNSGASFTVSLFIATGGAGAPTITWSGSVACGAQIAYYEDAMNVLDPALGQTSFNNGSGNPHTTTGFNTTRADSLVVYFDVAAANTALGAPSGWTEDNDAGSATDAGRHVWGSKKVPNAGDASGNISVTGATGAWVQGQVEIMREAYTGLMSDKMEVGAWLEPPIGLSVSKFEVGAWLTPGSYPTPSGRRRRMAVVN